MERGRHGDGTAHGRARVPTPARPRLLGRARRAAFLALLAVLAVAGAISLALAGLIGRGVLEEAGGPDPSAALGSLLARLAVAQVLALVVLAGLAHVVARRSTRIVETVFQQEDRLMLAVAHEVRSPLSRLMVVLEEAMADQSGADAALKQAYDHGEALSELIDDLLETARVMSGGVAMPAEVVRLDEVATRVVQTRVDGVATIELDLQPVTAVGSPRLLRRALSNLVRNAAQHAYRGGPGPVRITVDGEGITVDDDGFGVPEEVLERLRYETPIRRRKAGLGLGLAGWVAELHGGRLVLANRDEGGFRARLAMPTDRSEPPSGPEGRPR